MSILSSEMRWYKSTVVSDAAGNGGRMSNTLSPTQTKNNIFPDVSQAERIAGSTKYRKMFIKIENDDDLTLFNSRLYVESPTPGQDGISIFLGTQTDTQSAITGAERKYGAGRLNANIVAGATTLTVMTEGATYGHFVNGDTIRVSNKPSVNDLGGTEEFVTINAAVTYAGDVATISFTPALANNYLAADTKVASVIAVGDVACSATAMIITSSGGDYDDTLYPLDLDNLGTTEQVWTLTFTSGTAFNITGDVLGAVGSGNVTTDTAPNNPAKTAPYFTLESSGFSGSFLAGDTIVFTTHPAAIPVWYRRDVPAGAASYSADKAIVAVDGESG